VELPKKATFRAAENVCDENLCKIQLQFWLQWGNLPWITFRGNIEVGKESDNICHLFVKRTVVDNIM